MREILFKAQIVIDKKWVEGDLTHNHDTGWCFIKEYNPKGEDLTHMVIPETVCQFIGLPDRNKKKAFEGDCDSDGNILVWCDICSGWQFGQIDIPTKEIVIRCHACDGNFFLQDHICGFEIIGNIHD